jgi:DNA-binding CsgD family transcriptional regulator/tetratricopeptide (TPR) repeat protein
MLSGVAVPSARRLAADQAFSVTERATVRGVSVLPRGPILPSHQGTPGSSTLGTIPIKSPGMAAGSPFFVGRTAEKDRLGHLLQGARAGESAALVIRGPAGIGKTALLNECAKDASDFRVARISGIESELELPFAGLHQLCAPMMNEAGSLPTPQRDALRVAFGLISGEPPDQFLVALAVLSLVSEVAQKGPLLCLVDDAQWLDAASAQVFGVVARRILGESVVMLFSIRDPAHEPQLEALPELFLAGLADRDARALLQATIPGRIDDDVRDRIVAETLGNPLALLELPRDMTAAELAGGFPLPQGRDIPKRVEETFLQRLGSLPEPTQKLMLIAAADPTGDPTLLRRAARILQVQDGAASVAGTEGLIEIGPHVHFRHPLVRSAIYWGARPSDRRAVHLALAQALDQDADPDRGAWHRALAATGPDEAVASELEGSSGRAQSRGGLAAAAAFLTRAAELTPDRERRADRALAAAQMQIQVGSFVEANRLLTLSETDEPNEQQLARIDLLRGQISLAGGPVAAAPAQLLRAAKRLEQFDRALARDTYLDAWGAAMFAAQPGQTEELRRVSTEALSLPTSAGPAGLPDLLLEGLARLGSQGLQAATPTLWEAIQAFFIEDLPVDKGLQWSQLAAAVAGTLWDFDSMAAVLSRQAELARQTGALVPLFYSLIGHVFAIAWQGDLTKAAELAAEADTLTEVIGIQQVAMGSLLLAALTGDEPRSSAFIQAGIDLSTGRNEGTAAQVAYWAASILFNGLGQYRKALSQSLKATAGPTQHLDGWALPELIEAAARTGEHAFAEQALERLADSANANATDWGQGNLARSRGIVAQGADAEQHYQEAIERFARTALRPEHARARLVYGEWLRRQNRRIDAREQLRTAHTAFSEIGMRAFAERALNELLATGETVRKRRDDTRNDLTSQETQIARLALGGMTNPEIGAQLYISPRTVEWHLRKIFTKLGITSRRGLTPALLESRGV